MKISEMKFKSQFKSQDNRYKIIFNKQRYCSNEILSSETDERNNKITKSLSAPPTTVLTDDNNVQVEDSKILGQIFGQLIYGLKK